MKKSINRIFILVTLICIIILTADFLLEPEPQAVINKAKKIKTASGVMESIQLYSMIRAFPDKDIPEDKFYKAFEYSKNEMSEAQLLIPSQWTSMGPNNIGGRSLSLAFHPVDTGTIWMGSASGGLWKSTTGGLGATAWTRIETGFPSLAVSWIEIDSLNPNIMFIGTGENYGYQWSLQGVDVRVTRGMYGIGILKTTNGGTTWTKSLDWTYNNQRGVWRVKMNPKNHNILYAATSEGVYKTNNAGGTWTQILNYQMVMDLEINHTDTSIVYISVGNLSNDIANPNVGIYKSVNSGVTFTKLAGGLPSFWSGKAMIELYKGNQNYVYASIPNDVTNYVGYYTSTDAGASWTFKTSSVSISPQGWYNNAHIVKPDDPNVILVGTIDVVKSINGGQTFTTKSSWSAWNTGATPPGAPESSANNYSHADQHEYFVNPKDANKLYCITDGGLYRSNNFGETYYSCNGGYVTSQFYGGFVNSYQDSNWCLGGLQDNRAAFFQGTNAWYKTFVGDGMWCGVNSQNHNICYTEYTYGQLYKSNNGGVTFNSSGMTPPGAGNATSYCFVTPYIVSRSNPNVMYIAGTSVYRSNVGGGSWQNLGSLGAKALSMDGSATSTDTIYVGTIPVLNGQPAAIWRTTNGSSFTNVSTGQIPNSYPTDIHVNPNNSKEVYVTFGGFGNGHVYKSTNAGLNWINISANLPDVPHQSICIDPMYPQNVYAGNDLGVYVSTNGGVSWSEFRTGMPYALVFDLTISYPNRNIRATTHGNGVWTRSLIQYPVSTGKNENNIPNDFALQQNYPNPFNPVTRIKYSVPIAGHVSLKVYDIKGHEAAGLVIGEQKAGNYEVTFDATKLASGIYFCKMTSGSFSKTIKMMYVK